VTSLHPLEGAPFVALVGLDDASNREAVHRLRARGFRAHVKNQLPAEPHLLHACQPLIVVLGVPGELTREDVIGWLRATKHGVTGCLCVTAEGDASERVALLEAGAADVMSAPVDYDELSLRVANLHSRRGPATSRLVVGGLVLDEEAREVTMGERRVRLSPTEFGLLRLLLRNRGVVLTKERILHDVWGYQNGDVHVVELYISYLRKKLGPDARGLILTVRGSGYLARGA